MREGLEKYGVGAMSSFWRVSVLIQSLQSCCSLQTVGPRIVGTVRVTLI